MQHDTTYCNTELEAAPRAHTEFWLQGWLSHSPVRECNVLLRDEELARGMAYGRQPVSWRQQITMSHSSWLWEYQTGVANSSTSVNVIRAQRHFASTSFFLTCFLCIYSITVVFCVAAAIIFSSMELELTPFVYYFYDYIDSRSSFCKQLKTYLFSL